MPEKEYITVDMFNRAITDLKQEIRVMNDNILVNKTKIDMIEHSQGIWFMVLTLVVGLMGFLTTLAPMFREMYKDARKNSQTLTEENIRSVVRDEFARLKAETH